MPTTDWRDKQGDDCVNSIGVSHSQSGCV